MANVATVKLWCLVQGIASPFRITATADNDIDDVRKKIYEVIKDGSLRAPDLTLWKYMGDEPIMPSDTLLERVLGNASDLSTIATKLDVALLVPAVFPRNDGGVRLDIIVEPPSAALRDAPNRGLKRKRETDSTRENEISRLQNIWKEAPSSLAKPSTLHEKSKGIVCCNRPLDYGTIPIALLQEEFGMFKDDCEQSPSPKAQEFFVELAQVVCEWYDVESAREDNVRKVFRDKADLQLEAQKIAGTLYVTDGNSPFVIIPPRIRECKNKPGEPFVLSQGIGYYVQYVVNELRDTVRRLTRFPCILMIDIGSYLAFYGCLWTGENLHVEPLTPIYDLTTHWTDEAAKKKIASSLDAFLKIVTRLDAHYEAVNSSKNVMATRNPPQDFTYPYKTSYEKEGCQVKFEYLSRVSDKLAFIAMTDDGDCLYIKFTRQYSTEAHRYLAERGHAPQLRAVDALPGGWFMVVMDRSDYTLLQDILRRPVQMENGVKSKVLSILEELHAAGFVHGDVREVNVLVDRDSLAESSNDGIRIHLVDFDWAGKIGEATYPLWINTKSVRRPDDVRDGMPISVEHDNEMAQLFFEL